MILQIFHIIALTLLQNSSLFAVCSYLKHSNTGEIARAEKRRSMINILVKLCSLAHQEGTPNNPKTQKIPRPKPRDLFCLELFAMFANLVANGARSFASGLAGSRAFAAAAGAQGLFQHSFINSLDMFSHVYYLQK